MERTTDLDVFAFGRLPDATREHGKRELVHYFNAPPLAMVPTHGVDGEIVGSAMRPKRRTMSIQEMPGKMCFPVDNPAAPTYAGQNDDANAIFCSGPGCLGVKWNAYLRLPATRIAALCARRWEVKRISGGWRVSRDFLYRSRQLSDYLREREDRVYAEIEGLKSDYVLKVSLDDLTEHLAGKYRIEPVVLLTDRIHIVGSGDTKMDMSGDPRYAAPPGERCLIPATLVEFAVPFQGDAIIFDLAPSTTNFNPPRAVIDGMELRFRYVRPDHDHAAMRAEFDRDVQNVQQYLDWGNNDIGRFNANLGPQIRRRLDQRKEKFLKDQGMVAALGFPLKPRTGVSNTYAAPVKRKISPTLKPAVPPGAFKPEPALEEAVYEHILGVASNMVQVMERSPKAFVSMGEEDLRTHILVLLNYLYEWQASGETFNYDGKTDILIRAEGKNIFIAECKFWTGAKAFTGTIDQLLNYVSWRDTKTAIIIFNRNRDTSAVIAQISDLVKKHPNFKREITTYKHETGFRFVLGLRDDKNRELTMTVLVFDVPV